MAWICFIAVLGALIILDGKGHCEKHKLSKRRSYYYDDDYYTTPSYYDRYDYRHTTQRRRPFYTSTESYQDDYYYGMTTESPTSDGIRYNRWINGQHFDDSYYEHLRRYPSHDYRHYYYHDFGRYDNDDDDYDHDYDRFSDRYDTGTPDRPGYRNYGDQVLNRRPHKQFSNSTVSLYYREAQRCCRGNSFNKYPNSDVHCCGNEEYDKLREVCCWDNKYPLKPGFTCCGKEYINTDETFCCENSRGFLQIDLPQELKDSKEDRLNTLCCSEQLYNVKTHRCCETASYYHERTSNFTVIEKLYKVTGCCDGKPYNEEDTYCNGKSGQRSVVLSIEKSPVTMDNSRTRGDPPKPTRKQIERTCGKVPYNPSTQICCGYEGVTFSNTSKVDVKIWDVNDDQYPDCCGTEMYDMATHTCCNGTLHNVTESQSLGCCGSQYYDLNTHICCDNSPNNMMVEVNGSETGCCGDQGTPYDSSKELCCKTGVVQVPRDRYSSYYRVWDYECCESEDPQTLPSAYQTDRHICCNGSITEIGRYSYSFDQKCCGQQAYDKWESICCGGQLKSRTSEEGCCNEKFFNTTIHLCCGGKLIFKTTGHEEVCCGDEPYDHILQSCCQNPETQEYKITHKKSREESCCNGEPYNPLRQICCGKEIVDNDGDKLCCFSEDSGMIERNSTGIILVKTDPGNTCCGVNQYNTTSEICCWGNVYPRESTETKCCGTRAYHTEKEICCKGVVLPADDIEDAKCCYSHMTVE